MLLVGVESARKWRCRRDLPILRQVQIVAERTIKAGKGNRVDGMESSGVGLILTMILERRQEGCAKIAGLYTFRRPLPSTLSFAKFFFFSAGPVEFFF